MTKRTFTISTTDEVAFTKLMVAAAGLGTFSVHVIEMKEPPQASKPPAFVPPGWKEPLVIGGRTDGKEG